MCELAGVSKPHNERVFNSAEQAILMDFTPSASAFSPRSHFVSFSVLLIKAALIGNIDQNLSVQKSFRHKCKYYNCIECSITRRTLIAWWLISGQSALCIECLECVLLAVRRLNASALNSAGVWN